jgi:5-methylcytosine-specific restriction endonuclease McrA
MKANVDELKTVTRKRRSVAQMMILQTRLHLRDGRICGICKKPMNAWGKDVQLDHRIPLSKGGTEDESNLQMTHRYCNQRKGNREQ